jgi:predicted  nucleic acid-binding Zn-ribbon protein
VQQGRDQAFVALREQVARLEERLTASGAREAELRREMAELRAERDHWRGVVEAERERVDRLLDQLATPPERRRWWRRSRDR